MRKIPIRLAKKLGHITADYRWFAAVYLLMIFFFIPAIIFGLSVAGWEVLAGVGVPIQLFIICIIVINVLQDKKPSVLPRKLRSWEWLPKPLHSMEPWDRVFKRCGEKCSCCPCCDNRTDKIDSVEIDIPVTKSEPNGIAVISDDRL